MAHHPLLATGEEQVMMAEDGQGLRAQLAELMRQFSLLGESHAQTQNQLRIYQDSAAGANANLERRLSQHVDSRLGQAQLSMRSSQKQVTVKPPKPQRFKGNVEGPRMLEWLHQAEVYLLASSLANDLEGVHHIASFFESDAAVWWRHYLSDVRAGTVAMPQAWDEMKECIRQQFQVFNFETEIKDRYYALRQIGSVNAYISKFRSLVVELPEETEKNKIYQFLKGLKPEIQARTRTHKPKTLTQAMDIADEADRSNNHAFGLSGKYAKTLAREAAASTFGGPAPMQIGAISSDADQQRLRQENRCFYCRKAGHQARECKKKKADMVNSRRKKRRPDGRRIHRRSGN